MTPKKASKGMRTPWGAAQYVKHHAPGISFVGTGGHGGYKLSRERNAKVDAVWRRHGGWYEEDCDWAIVHYTFPEAFTDVPMDAVLTSLMNWLPDEYEAVAGKRVTSAESIFR
jgi:hypothetical protein